MAKGQATETQVNLKINGESASNTIKSMGSEVRTLRRELAAIPVDTQEFIEKAKQLSVAEDKLLGAKDAAKQVRQEMNALGDTTQKAKGDLLSLTPFGNMIKGWKDSLSQAREGIMANVEATGLLKLGFAALGIGLIVAAVASLYQYFTKTDEGAKKLDGALRAIGFVTGTLIKLLSDLGGKMVAAFENPKQALKDFGDFLLNNIINRFKAFGVILDGIINLDIKKINDGVIQAGTGIENATDKMAAFGEEIKQAVESGFELATLMDDIDEKETKLIVTNARAEKQISQLLLQAKDRTKSEGERLALLDRASALETNRLKDQIALQKDKVYAEKIAAEEAIKNDNDADAAKRKLAEAEAALIGLQKDSIDLQEKISNRRNAILDASADKAKAMAENEKKLAEEAAKNSLEAARKLTELRIANIVDEDERKKAIIEAEFQKSLEDLFLKDQLTEELIIENAKQRDLKLAELAQEKRDREAQEFEEQIEIDVDRVLLLADNTLAAQADAEQKVYDLKKAAANNRIKVLEDEGKTQSLEYRKQLLEIEKLDTDHQKKRQENAKKTDDFNTKLLNEGFNQSSQYFGGLANLLESDTENRRKNADAIKVFKIGELLTSSAAEIAGIWENANKNWLNSVIPGWGPIWAAAQTGLAVARTGLGVSSISKQKFSSGGLIDPKGGVMNFGQRHSSGGIHLIDGLNGQHYGEVERGEALMVLSRPFVENNGPAINMMLDSSLYRGGSKIDAKFEDGGIIPVNTATQPGTADAQAAAQSNLDIVNEIRMMRNDMANWKSTLRAEVVYEQAKQVFDDAESIEAKANAA
jgi:hypothetical protein